MTHQQIRELRSAIEEVDLHCDVIAELPLEISQIVLQHLPIHQIFQARRVSSKWRQILSSAQTVEPLLRGWFPKGNVGLSLQIPEGVSSESVASLKAEHVDAYRTGHAFTYASHERDCSTPRSTYELVAYAEGFMAWISPERDNQVRSLDLKTGQKWLFVLADRTKAKNIAISSSMVVVSTSECCHVWSLTTGESHYLRYSKPSYSECFVSVSGESLAFAQFVNSIGGKCGFEAQTWTLKDQRPSRFFLAVPTETDGETDARSVMLDSNRETLVFFYTSTPWFGATMRFCFSRTNLDGDVLAQGDIETPSISGSYSECCECLVPKEANGRAVIWSFNEGGSSSELMLIGYNFQESCLEIRSHKVDGLGKSIDIGSKGFYWKDVVYYLDHEKEPCILKVVDLQELTCRDAKVDIPTSTKDLRTSKEFPRYLFGDETFVIAIIGPVTYIWCFDKNVQMVNEDISYRENRKKNIKKRHALWRDG